MDEEAIWIEGGANPDLSEINALLEKGWQVKLCTGQGVSTGSTYATEYGGFLVILEKKLDIL